jgi:hypothetical protein
MGAEAGVMRIVVVLSLEARSSQAADPERTQGRADKGRFARAPSQNSHKPDVWKEKIGWLLVIVVRVGADVSVKIKAMDGLTGMGRMRNKAV